MQPGVNHAGEIWTDVLGWQQGEVKIGDDGWADFACPSMSIAIFTNVKAKGREQFGKDK